ncbi:hypothetical protein [Roseovarius aestuariivivens]|uniref:hypothetical protein n=1 Tax=Roseovarius aestuariivivens TaxID=1888910 RepID=UPI0014367678|nr:hypothetical protein [Roseovarius aestuariivivens]
MQSINACAAVQQQKRPFVQGAVRLQAWLTHVNEELLAVDTISHASLEKSAHYGGRYGISGF